MSLESAIVQIDSALDCLQRAKAELTQPPLPVFRTVLAGENLQAALDAGGEIHLESGGTWEGTYTVQSDTILFGPGASIRGVTAPALMIPPGRRNVTVDGVELDTAAREILTIGANDATQTTLEDAPTVITLRNLQIPHGRVKRAVAIHGRHVLLDRCVIEDVWDPAGTDSQAVYIGNAPGPVAVQDCTLSAGSEVLLVGGDQTRIPGLVPEYITVERCTLHRPLSWKTDGVSRKVKNLFELKSGRHVICRDSVLRGCWVDGQQGEAFTFTPALDGSRQTPVLPSGIVEDVLIEGCDISECSTGFGLLGRHYSAYTEPPLTGLVVRNNRFRLSRVMHGGRGQLATIGAGPGSIVFDSNRVLCDGSSLIYYYQGSYILPDGTMVPGGQIGELTLIGNMLGVVGAYGIMLDGYANLANTSSVQQLTITGNTFGGSTAMQARLPGNSWMSAEAFQALPEWE